MLGVLFNAISFLISFSTPAEAGFLVPFIIPALAGTFAGAAVAFAVNLAVGFGLSYVASKLLSKKPDQPTAPSSVGGVQLDVRLDSDTPQSLIVGRAATAGSRNYANTYGPSSDNSDLIEIFTLADHRCTGLVAVLLEGKEVTLQAPSGDRGQVVDDYNSNLALKFYDGTQTAVDAFTYTHLGAAANMPWPVEAVGTDRCYVRVHTVYNQELTPGPMRWIWVVDGIKLYDPRKDSSVGGSGSHRFGTESTYEWTDNLAVICYNICRGIYVDNFFLYGLENTTADQLPLDIWFAAMNVCDVIITNADSSTERQFTGGAEILVNTEPRDTIKELLKSCGGRFVEIGGTYKLYIGAPGLPVLSFDDGSVPASREERYKPILTLDDTVNYLTASYTSPTDGWVTKIAPPRGNSDWQTEDGRRLPADLPLPMVHSGTQVQRLQEQLLNRSRQQRKHIIPLPPTAMIAEPGDTVEWTSVRNGYTAKLFEVDAVDYEPNLTTLLSVTEVDPADYDWDTGLEFEEADGLLITSRPSPKVVGGFDADSFIYYGDLGNQRPAIRLIWDDPADGDASGVQWEIRTVSDPSNVAPGLISGADKVAASEVIILAGLQSLTAYEVRARFTSYNGFPVDWSLWIPVTTPHTVIVENDLADEIRETLSHVAPALAKAFAGLSQADALVIEDTVSQILANVVRDRDETAILIERHRSEIHLRANNISADVVTETFARISADDAEAAARLALQVTVNSNTAAIASEAVTRATADSAEATSRLALAATVASGDSTNAAAITTESTARATADSALSSSISSLTTTVGTNTASISTLTTSVNGVSVKFGVLGTINGVTGGFIFTGITKLDGSVTFAVEISGSLVVDGTITAAKLNVTTLSAITANVGTLTAGLLQSVSTKMKVDLDNERIEIWD